VHRVRCAPRRRGQAITATRGGERAVCQALGERLKHCAYAREPVRGRRCNPTHGRRCCRRRLATRVLHAAATCRGSRGCDLQALPCRRRCRRFAGGLPARPTAPPARPRPGVLIRGAQHANSNSPISPPRSSHAPPGACAAPSEVCWKSLPACSVRALSAASSSLHIFVATKELERPSSPSKASAQISSAYDDRANNISCTGK